MFPRNFLKMEKDIGGYFLLFLIAIHPCVCEDTVRMYISRNVHLDGFHRMLEIEFLVDNLLTEFKNCKWAMDQIIPSGAYVDPYQIKEYERSNVILHALMIDGFKDIEAAEQHAEAHRLMVFFNDTTVKLWNKLYVNFPFHLRYHKADSGGGSAIVQLGGPKLLLRCFDMILSTDVIKAPCCSHCRECDWNVIHPIQATEDIFLQVPVGNLDHREFVTIITLIMIIGGCYYIITPVSEIIKF